MDVYETFLWMDSLQDKEEMMRFMTVIWMIFHILNNYMEWTDGRHHNIS